MCSNAIAPYYFAWMYRMAVDLALHFLFWKGKKKGSIKCILLFLETYNFYKAIGFPLTLEFAVIHLADQIDEEK